MSSLDETLGDALDTLTRAGLRRVLRPLHHRAPGVVHFERQMLADFSSNDYLGLAADPRLAHAVTNALEGESFGAAAARLISGNHPLHESLERDLARFKRTDAALLFGSGYLANIGAIPALVGPRDVIYADALNHASLIDGCRLSRAEFRTFAHQDVDQLEAMMGADAGKFRRRLIVVDGVFSMDGDLAPLPDLIRLARTHDAWTYVDDAHGTGVLGEGGRGSLEYWNVEGEIDVVMGTLGKALGTAGAFICGSHALIDHLLNRARAFVFTTGSPPALAAAAIEALRIVRKEPERRTQLRAIARILRTRLAEHGYRVPGPADGHIIPLHIGEADVTVRVGAALREHGFLVGAVRPPTVPVGASRLRLTVSSAHTAAQIDGLVTALGALIPA